MQVGIKIAGIDAVELHGHEGYLLDQFKSELWNHREDEYGGELKNRLKFTIEIVEAIKKSAGKEFPVIYRFGLTHKFEGGRTIEEGLEIAKCLEDSGVDALHVDAGAYESWHWAHPPIYQEMGCLIEMAEAVKKVVNIPVIAVGRLDDSKLAEEVLMRNQADFVALGRQLLADENWPNKVKNGKIAEIRPCIGDHEGCLGRTFSGMPLSCSVNPRVGLENELTLSPAKTPYSILVIGGGPAGMEFARVASLRGHKIRLLEKCNRLGGNLIPASTPSFKSDLKKLVEYFENQLSMLGVEVLLNYNASPEMIEKQNSDFIVIATGATINVPTDLKQLNRNLMISSIELLLDETNLIGKQNFLVLGGGFIGCEAAVYLKEKGKDVTIVEKEPNVISDMFLANKKGLMQLVEKYKVRILTNSKILNMDSNKTAVLEINGKIKEVPCDLVVLATGLEPRNELINSLRPKIKNIYTIGDCEKPGNVFGAIKTAFRLGRVI